MPNAGRDAQADAAQDSSGYKDRAEFMYPVDMAPTDTATQKALDPDVISGGLRSDNPVVGMGRYDED